MPTITFSLKDFQQLLGKKVSQEELKDLLEFAKAELEKSEEDNVSVKYNDTNLPYLWSVEGLTMFLRGVLGKQKGIPALKLEKSKYELVVDKSVADVRPFISSFIAKGKKIDDYLLKQLIQLQEKIADNYGRRRQKIAIGIYRSEKIKFPITYKAVKPESVKFVPLEFSEQFNLREILEKHPKGKEYAWILKDAKTYPLLVDASQKVLSFPPVINSNDIGKLEVGDSEIFFEATGTDEKSVNLAAVIFAYAMAERGFKIYSVDSKRQLLNLETESISIKKEDIKNLLGLELKDSQIKDLLERALYNVKVDSSVKVEIPPFRNDIMHPVDIIEDIAILYGYKTIEPLELKTQTIGETFELTKFIDKIRELLVGLKFQEIWSAVLNNKQNLYSNMNVKDFGTVEIEEFVSETYSVVRSWLTPLILEVFSKNRHIDFPQLIFEQGTVNVRNSKEIKDFESLAFGISHSDADFTEAKKALDFIFRVLETKYSIEHTEHSSFIPGRVGKIMVSGKQIGIVGEISPQVLSNWKLEMPVVVAEMNLNDLFEVKD